MDKQMAQLILQFMQRVTLQGSEVAAYTAACNALAAIIAGKAPSQDVPEAGKGAKVPLNHSRKKGPQHAEK